MSSYLGKFFQKFHQDKHTQSCPVERHTILHFDKGWTDKIELMSTSVWFSEQQIQQSYNSDGMIVCRCHSTWKQAPVQLFSAVITSTARSTIMLL